MNKKLKSLRLKEGSRIELIKMEGEDKMQEGLRGTFMGFDDVGHILVEWDNRSTLSLVVDVDEFRTLSVDELDEESESDMMDF